MKLNYTPAVFFLLAGLPVAGYLLWQGWRNRTRQGAAPFLVLIALSTTWVIEAALEMLSADLSAKLLWADIQYLSIVFVPVAWLAVAIDYTGNRSWLSRRNICLLCLVPLVMLGLQWTNSHHHLMRAEVWLDTSGGNAVIGRTFGPLFWFHATYSYVLIASAMVILFHAVLSGPPMRRKQPAFLLAGFAVPCLWNAFYLLKPELLPAFDYTPALFALGELIVAYGLFRFQMFDLVMVARDTLVETMGDGLLVLDEAGKVADLNEAARAIIGPPAGAILGASVADTWAAWGQLAGPYGEGADRAPLNVDNGGEHRNYEVHFSHLTEQSAVRGRLLVIHDVTDRCRLEQSLRMQAFTDGLTGLANRTMFMARLTDLVHLGRRHANKMFAVMVLDLDRFKFINDTVGHPAGDAVLENVAVRLKRCVREADMVARLGGDEFMVLLTEVASSRDVVMAVERIQDEMRAPMYARQQQMLVSISAGVVLWDNSYLDADDLLHAADTAMYQAKQAGGGCYRIFDERMHRTMLDSVQAEAELRAAVEKGDFGLDYQPVLDIRTGDVVSLEALVRWQHPHRGTLPPDAFIGIAESSGLIIPLGEMILDQVCSQLGRWRTRTSAAFELPARVNVSPRQLIETDFVDAMLTRISAWHLPAGSLTFEITEAALSRDPVRAGNAVKKLSSIGMRVCLDDFGTGPSSLQNLTSFSGQEIKLDCALVGRLAEGSIELALAKSIVELAHALDLVVTAEGVESRRTWELLEGLGCDQIQGFYCAEPMTPPLLLDYLRERQMTPGLIEVHRNHRAGG